LVKKPSADLIRQLDDDPLRAADVAEPIAVFVALHLANELRAAGSQASDDGVDIVDCECDMAETATPRLQVYADKWQFEGSIQGLQRAGVAIRDFAFTGGSVAELSSALYGGVISDVISDGSLHVFDDRELEEEILGLMAFA
jgi:hypothetical protein